MLGPHVCLFHSNRLLSECLAAALKDAPGCECSVHPSASFDDLAAAPLGRTVIDVLLLDAELEEELVDRIVRRVRHVHPDCKVVLLIAEHGMNRMIEMAQLGSHGCLFEGAGLAEVRDAIATVLTGRQFCSPQLANALLHQMGRQDRGSWSPRWDDASLTEREREVLQLIALEQLGNKQIARHLGLSLYTVKNHVHNIIEKLGVQNRHEAVNLARRRGLLVGEQATRVEADKVRFSR